MKERGEGADGRPLVLFYTSFFGRKPPFADEPPSPFARVTLDCSRIREADIVIFHVPDAWQAFDAPRYPGQVWVAWSLESPAHYPLWRDAAFMAHFDLVMSHERSADVWMPYLPTGAYWQSARARTLPRQSELAPVVLFQSATVDGNRNAFAFELMKAIRVDSYGKLFHNRDLQGPDLGRQTKLDVIGRYPFCCAFENATTPDYVTEKVFDALLAGTIPIYRGTRDVAEFVPPGSYIDASDFASPAALADHLRRVLADEALQAGYVAWRSRPLPEPLARWIDDLERRPALARLVEAASAVSAPLGRKRGGLPRLPFGLSAYLRTRLRRVRRAAGRW